MLVAIGVPFLLGPGARAVPSMIMLIPILAPARGVQDRSHLLGSVVVMACRRR